MSEELAKIPIAKQRTTTTSAELTNKSHAKSHRKKIKKDPSFPVIRVVLIVFSFLLAIMDMTFLYSAISKFAFGGEGEANSMLIALLLATAANITALYWGYHNGKHLEEHTINKRTIGSFLGWVFIGVIYAVIRLSNFNANNSNGELIQIAMLAVSYIGSGTLIQSSMQVLADAETTRYRKAKKLYEKFNKTTYAPNRAEIRQSIKVLKKYDRYYKNLDKSYEKIKNDITAEASSTLSKICGAMVNANPGISPVHVEKVKDETLEKGFDKL